MASRKSGGSGYTRRILLLALAIGVAIVGYTFGWNYAAHRLVGEANARVAALNASGRRANCENAEARGYPFRIGLFCRSIMYVDAPSGVAVRAGAFRSAAQVYQPQRVVGELEGPAIVEFPGINALEVTWDALRASSRLASPRPDILSVEATGIAVGPDSAPAGERPAASAQSAEFHMRPSGPGSDVAWRFERLSLDPDLLGDGTLPLLSGEADLHFPVDPAPAFSGQGLRGLAMVVNSMVIRTAGDETAARVEGPFSIDEAGLIDAELSLSVENPQVFAQIMAELFPAARDQIRLAFAGVSMLGDNPTLPMRISKGDVSIGFLKLGTLPPL
ncbi:DUF2125 domain-containing protein [Aliihoeflea sp. 40Bstr573]|uniref:DUF2125 domain-containing protein n=1 Tax=Aliihoeflea sp. 40Bstr573 TaxID=2696467 RepID=UPI002094081D|nr:DUF2125 domain-containing protein [Aliihoeflea sp. 40Bstr573]MCO6387150.1 DUF2125 domain-containing protein [Aliihoeflea sp. 40Bstr573]